MSRIFITGSADGLGYLAAKSLVEKGHKVVLHARNPERSRDALKKLPGAENAVTGDLSNIEEIIKVAEQVNALGLFDAVIHNAGVYRASAKDVFTVNTLAPYILTCLIHKPERLIYLSSGMHLSGQAKLECFQNNISSITYSDTKLHVVVLSKAAARKWPEVFSNSVDPGWVPTRMGGPGAPDDLQKGYETQVWLAVSNDKNALVSGKYFHHQKIQRCNPEADDTGLQNKFLDICEKITGIAFP